MVLFGNCGNDIIQDIGPQHLGRQNVCGHTGHQLSNQFHWSTPIQPIDQEDKPRHEAGDAQVREYVPQLFPDGIAHHLSHKEEIHHVRQQIGRHKTPQHLLYRIMEYEKAGISVTSLQKGNGTVGERIHICSKDRDSQKHVTLFRLPACKDRLDLRLSFAKLLYRVF